MITSGHIYFSSETTPRLFDLLVVGGGITGCGVALDAAARGFSVLLGEQHDFASHTSSRSSKLVHGGIRYLENLDFALVGESLAEQRLLTTTLAPYHVKPLTFTMPLKSLGAKAFYLRMGTALYDFLGNRRGAEKSQLLDREKLAQNLGFVSAKYKVGLAYRDAQMEDARLVFSVAHTASDKGAVLLNHTVLKAARKTATGFSADLETPTGRETINAKKVILAVGAYATRLQDQFGTVPIEITPSKGSHILVDRARLPGTTAFVGKTARSVLFCIPFDHHWVIGTTESIVRSVDAGEQPSEDDIQYILQELNPYLSHPLVRSDVIGAFAGVRPLVSHKGRDSTKLSRSHAVVKTEYGATLVTGGKYTTYRVMAKDAVDTAFKTEIKAGAVPPSTTATLPLWGAEGWAGEDSVAKALTDAFGISGEQARRLTRRYGLKAGDVLSAAGNDNRRLTPLFGGGPFWAEVIFAITHEGASTLTDILHRRLRLDLDCADAGLSVAAAVLDTLDTLATLHGTDDRQINKAEELTAFEKACGIIRSSEYKQHKASTT